MTFTQYIQAHMALMTFVANACLIWVLAFYTPELEVRESKSSPAKLSRDRGLWIARGLLAGCATYVASGQVMRIGIFTFLFGCLFTWLRRHIPARWLAETELLGNTAYLTILTVLTHRIGLFAGLPSPGHFITGHVVTVKLILSIVIYVEIGGTNIVRGLLEKGLILPRAAVPRDGSSPDPASPLVVDTTEYNHGRLIGNAERLLLVALVAIQAYQALAFLMTAKGLFRAKELENRNFSEYFLVGTLVSSSIAVAAGLLIQLVIHLCW